MNIKDIKNLLSLGIAKLTPQDIINLIQSGADVNICDDGGATPLMLALSNNVPVVELLLRAGANPNLRADDGVTALMLAAGFHNDVSVTETLLKSGANVNAQDNAGRTPLMYAARKNSIAILSALVNAGADLAMKDRAGRSALDYLEQNATLKDNAEAQKLLIAPPSRAIPSVRFANILAAAKEGNVTDIELLIASGADVNVKIQNGWTPLMFAAGYNTPDVVEVLLNAGADLKVRDSNGWTPLLTAARMSKSADVVKLLVQAGADRTVKTAKGNTALGMLSQNPNLKDNTKVRKLFEAAQPSNIAAAAKDGSLDEVVRLLAAGADPNVRTQNGWTPLMFAAGYNTPDIVTVLLNAGADINFQDQNGWTPLLTAARMSKSVDVVRKLVMSRADLSVKTAKGNTILGMLAQNPNLKDNAEVRELFATAMQMNQE